MAFAPFDLLGAVKAFCSSAIGGFDRLRVDNGGTRLPRAAFQHTEIAAQGVVDPLPDPLFSPGRKIGIDDAPRRQIMGDKAPGTAGAQAREERIDDLPFGIGLRPATRFGGRDEWCENLPFGIIEVSGRGLSGFHTAMLSQLATLIPLF